MASWFFKEKRNSIFVLKILYKSWLNSETENNRDLQPLFLTGTKGDTPEPLLEPPASQHQRDTAEALVPPFVPFFPWPPPARPIWIKTWTQLTQCCGSLPHTAGRVESPQSKTLKYQDDLAAEVNRQRIVCPEGCTVHTCLNPTALHIRETTCKLSEVNMLLLILNDF